MALPFETEARCPEGPPAPARPARDTRPKRGIPLALESRYCPHGWCPGRCECPCPITHSSPEAPPGSQLRTGPSTDPMTRILLTGVAAFIGSHLAESLTARDHE